MPNPVDCCWGAVSRAVAAAAAAHGIPSAAAAAAACCCHHTAPVAASTDLLWGQAVGVGLVLLVAPVVAWEEAWGPLLVWLALLSAEGVGWVGVLVGGWALPLAAAGVGGQGWEGVWVGVGELVLALLALGALLWAVGVG